MKYQQKITFPIKDSAVWPQAEDKKNPIISHYYTYENNEDYNKLVNISKEIPFECWDSDRKLFVFNKKIDV